MARMKNKLRRKINAIIGYHTVDEPDLAQAIRNASKPATSFAAFKFPRTGIFHIDQGNVAHYYCKKRIGWLFPSMYKLKLGTPSILIPHPIRIMSGGCILIFGFLMSIVTIVLLVEIMTSLDAGRLYLGLALLCVGNLSFWLAVWVFVVIERHFALSGFRSYANAP